MAIIPKAIALGSAVGAVGAVVVYGVTATPTGSGALVAARASSLPAVPFPTTTTYLPCKPPATLVKEVCVTKVAGPTLTKAVAPAGTPAFTPVVGPRSMPTAPQTTSSGSAVAGDDDHDEDHGDD